MNTNKFLTGLLVGGLLVAAGASAIICDKKNRCKLRHGNKFLSKTADLFEDVAHNL